MTQAQVQNQTFYNKIKIPRIPLLLVNNSFATEFKDKSNLINLLFSKQYTSVANESTPPPLRETPNETLSSFEITASDTGKIIKALNMNKAHCHNEISIRMLKLSVP